jgi:hypothetical protein
MKRIDGLAGAAPLAHDGQSFRSGVLAFGARDPERVEALAAGRQRLKVRVGLLVGLQRAQRCGVECGFVARGMVAPRPLLLRRLKAARPAGFMRRASISSKARFVFVALQKLSFFRGVNRTV